jgi:hypothetical protein
MHKAPSLNDNQKHKNSAKETKHFQITGSNIELGFGR